jgi:hypothetical protein
LLETKAAKGDAAPTLHRENDRALRRLTRLTPDDHQLNELRQLQPLVAYPRESVDVELKGWLRLDDPENAASLLKAILALANHGGGYVLLGFAEAGGTWVPDDDHRPANLSGYDQDALNALVYKYAEPVFHCELHHVPHPQSGAVHPVVVVPPGRVPIRAKRDGPEKKQVRKDSYYIRRPGPKSETPQTGQEWDELIRRCTLNDRERLLEEFRRLIGGRGSIAETVAPTEPPAKERLDEWAGDSRERWQRLVTEAGVESRYRHGVVTYSYLLEGAIPEQTPQQMLEVLERTQGRETGWPMWLVFRDRGAMSPRPANGTIESIFIDTVFRDPSHSDYWRAGVDSRMFLLRGYEEDGERDAPAPGTAFDLTIPVWRFGEALLHAERHARELGDPSALVHFRGSWDGLEGRALRSLWGRRSSPGDLARQDSVVSHLSVAAEEITPRLAELLRDLLNPLYAVFDFFEMPLSVIEEELAIMRDGAN